MFDGPVLVLAVTVVAIACNPKSQIPVGRIRQKPASPAFKLGVILPLGVAFGIGAASRLIGHLQPNLCRPCGSIPYGIIGNAYFGWVLTFIGLLGLRSFASVRGRINRAFIIIAVICGPFLLTLGFFEILRAIRG